MKAAVYTEGGQSLLGLVGGDDDEGLVLEPYGNLWMLQDEAVNLEALEDEIASGYDDGYPTPEAFVQDLARLLPDRVQLVPDGTPVSEVYPGPANDFRGRWLEHHPHCPNPPATRET
jgi:hypothetical protein